MVTIVKPNGSLRICIDPRDLNKAIKREPIEEIVTRMPNAKVFSVLDASSGFWQVKLDPPSAKLCTFNTPFGWYMFKRLPLDYRHPRIFSKGLCQICFSIDSISYGHGIRNDHRLCSYYPCPTFDRHFEVLINVTRCSIPKYTKSDFARDFLSATRKAYCSRLPRISEHFVGQTSLLEYILLLSACKLNLVSIQGFIFMRLVLSIFLRTCNSIVFTTMHPKLLPL